jgi:uncharacterized protein YxjI
MTRRVCTTMLLAAVMLCGAASGSWVQQPSKWNRRVSPPSLHMNLFDALTGKNANELKTVKAPLPYGDPILPVVSDSVVTLAIQERGISFTGEDFDVVSVPSNQAVCKVRGALLHLPGKDKMRIIDTANNNNVVAVLDRKLVALTPTYDIYRDSEKIAWIEKVAVAFRDCFEVHLEATPRIGPVKGPAAYKLQGDFLDRQFVMKAAAMDDQTVAVVSKTGWFPQFDAFNHYQVRVAPGMDIGLVVACMSAIDEEFDEEHQKRSEQEKKNKQGSGGGGWFG